MVILLESKQIFKCNLLDTWPKSSSVNCINLLKKICYNFGDMEIFRRGLFFIGAPCRLWKIIIEMVACHVLLVWL